MPESTYRAMIDVIVPESVFGSSASSNPRVAQIAAHTGIAGRLDLDYPLINLPRTDTPTGMMTFVLRGEFTASELNKLNTNPAVLGIWPDQRISFSPELGN